MSAGGLLQGGRLICAMSRRLRGQTTLQSLIGRTTTSKKAIAAQRAKRSGNPPAAGPSTSAPLPIPIPIADDASPMDPEKPELAPGLVACPVCGIGLGPELLNMNLHLGAHITPSWREARSLPSSAPSTTMWLPAECVRGNGIAISLSLELPK